MIFKTDNREFALHTNRTTYAFRVLKTGQLEHLYYGKKINIEKWINKSIVVSLSAVII